jgi:DNA-directed RNA polymerase subunit RPC12/RpoP
MEQRIFHGELQPIDLAEALTANFNRGSLHTQTLGNSERLIVQIATRPNAPSGGQTALTITVQKVEDGVLVQMGQQAWLGVAASLGHTALTMIRNPLALLGRIDDLAQDIENLQLAEKVWQVIADVSRAKGASQELSARLQRLTCEYCGTANPIGEPSCIACGAPLGNSQPAACKNCGFIIFKGEKVCPNCGRDIL